MLEGSETTAELIFLLKYYKSLADKAIEQVPNEKIFVRPEAESNSIAILMNHMAANMLSRWTDFFTSDGEKPWRNRDDEFEDTEPDIEKVKAHWESGWKKMLNVLETLRDSDWDKIVYIRKERYTVSEAIHRQFAHCAYHSGQIVFLSKMYCGQDWKTLSVPRKKAE